MRLTRDNLAAVVDALETLRDTTIDDDISTWTDLQDEPRTEDIAEEIRDVRESIETQLDDLTDVVKALYVLLVGKRRAATDARQEV